MFGFVRRALEKFAQASGWTLLDPNIRWLFNVQPSTSGVIVNRFTALSYPPMFKAVNLVSDYVSNAPLDIYEDEPNGGQQIDDDHVAYPSILRPHPLYSRETWIKTITSHAMLLGNGFSFVVRDEFARPYEHLILDPEMTFPEVIDGEIWYRTTIGYESYTISPADIVHIRNLTHMGLAGYPTIELLKEALGLGLAAQKYGAAYFRNNAQPKVVIKLPKKLKDKEAVEAFRRSWGETHAGPENIAKVAILDLNQAYPAGLLAKNF